MKKILLALIVSVTGVSAFAQDTVYSSSGRPVSDYRKRQKEEDKKFDKSKLIFGGGLIFGIGNGITNLGLSPIVGYRFTDKLAAGIGLGYQYYGNKQAKQYYDTSQPTPYPVNDFHLKTSIYSASLWARYLVFNNIFVHLEPEMNSYKRFVDWENNYSVELERVFVPSILVGAGIRQPITDRLSLVGILLYDVLQEPGSPYYRRVDIRFGFNVGF